MCEISVIIPVYNGERYLAECLDSVCHSTIFARCEILLIDDGSVDGSPDIIKAYEKKYHMIRGYTFPNQGPGISRNRGIQLAKGRYLFFLDCDDMVEPDYLEKLYEKMVQGAFDVVCAGYSIWKSSDICSGERQKQPVHRKVLESRIGSSEAVTDGCTWLERRMDAGDWTNQVWCALYDRQFLVDNHLEFCGEIYLYEDILFTTEILLRARTVGWVSAYGYLYRCHDNGLVNGGIRKKDIECALGILKFMRDEYSRMEAALTAKRKAVQENKNCFLDGSQGSFSLLKRGYDLRSRKKEDSNLSEFLHLKKQLHALGRVAAEMISMYVYFLEALHLWEQEEALWLGKLSDMGWKRPAFRSVSSVKELTKWGLCSFAPKLYYRLVNKGQDPVRSAFHNEDREKGLVSVIIPCFNSASDLENCLDSVCRQTYRDLEILVVDDGSEDESWSVIQHYEKRDRRVHGIRQSHQGVSAARNLGIQSARGKYIQFVDADDTIVPYFTAYMVHLQEKKPEALIVCDYMQYEEAESAAAEMEHFSMSKGYYSKRRWMAGLVRKAEAHYFGVLWNKLYRRDLIIKNRCCFPEELSLGEDFVFNMQYLSAVTGVVCSDKKMYRYLWKRKGSLTASADRSDRMIAARLKMYGAYQAFFKREGLSGLWQFWLHYYMIIAFFRICDENPVKEIQDRCYQFWIRDCGISRMEYESFRILRKLKQLERR